MGEQRPARLIEWQKPGQRKEYWVVWFDHTVDPPAKRRVNCRAHGATSRDDRRALLDKYQEIEAGTKVQAVVEAVDRHEHGRTAFDTPLAVALDRYKDHLDEQVAARSGADGVRVGLAESSADMSWVTVKLWLKYLVTKGLNTIKTGDVEFEHLAGWVRWLATKPGKKGPRRAATVGKHCRHLKAALRWLDAQRPRLLRDAPHVIAGLKPPRQASPSPEAIKPNDLQTFLRTALVREETATSTIRRQKGENGKVEEYEQGIHLPDTPVSRLFLLLAVLGCRRGEAVALRWSDIDFQSGVITIRA